MDEHLGKIPRHTPFCQVGNTIFDSRKPEIVSHYERIKCLASHGWEFEEYILEIEKRNIIAAIKRFNDDNAFPLELVERAREFFPNAKFTQASIKLE